MITREKLDKHFHESVSLLKSLIAGPEYNNIGFFASAVDKENYKRLFSRDAFWMGMAALFTGDDELIKAYEQSLYVLATNQREDGAIPSNISYDGKVSYGVINPRVDSTSLFILGVLQYYKRGKLRKYAELCCASAEKAFLYLKKNWENDFTGLLYIPRAGNWADEYFQEGYVLYDEALWHYVLSEYGDFVKRKGGSSSKKYLEQAKEVEGHILDNFWMQHLEKDPSPYMKKIERLFNLEEVGYYLHFFHLGNRQDKGWGHPHRVFDAFGNILLLASGIVPEAQSEQIRRFIDAISVNKYPLIPAHYPFMPEKDFKTYKLYQYRFKEYVGHYHNGGLWPWYTGVYVAYLSGINDRERALKYLEGIYRANTMKSNGKNFHEYHMNKAASLRTKVKHPEGVGLFMSVIMKNIVIDRKSMVLIKYNNTKVDLSDDIAVRSMGIPEGGGIKITAVGPDAEIVLRDILELSDEESRCLEKSEIKIKKDKPYGVPLLGISAAAYIIAYEAFYNNRRIFEFQALR